MAWHTILRVEKSEFSDKQILLFFEHLNFEKYCVVTKASLHYLEVKSINKGDNVYMLKSKGKNGKPYFIAKKVRKNNSNERGDYLKE